LTRVRSARADPQLGGTHRTAVSHCEVTSSIVPPLPRAADCRIEKVPSSAANRTQSESRERIERFSARTSARSFTLFFPTHRLETLSTWTRVRSQPSWWHDPLFSRRRTSMPKPGGDRFHCDASVEGRGTRRVSRIEDHGVLAPDHSSSAITSWNPRRLLAGNRDAKMPRDRSSGLAQAGLYSICNRRHYIIVIATRCERKTWDVHGW